MAKSASRIARTIQILMWRIRITRSPALGLHAIPIARHIKLGRKVPMVRRPRPLARMEQVASMGQVTEPTLTGRSWTKGSMHGGPIQRARGMIIT